MKKRKETERKLVQMEQRKQLSNVRVLQKNLVYVLSLPPKLISEDTLRSNEFFGQYGKITKVVINRRNPTIQQPTANTGVYITYTRKDEAARAIEAVDGSICDGRVIRATFGTTKYCSYYLKSQVCQNLGCQFLHEAGIIWLIKVKKQIHHLDTTILFKTIPSKTCVRTHSLYSEKGKSSHRLL